MESVAVSSGQNGEHAPIAAIVSRQRIVGPTNGSSAYLLAIAQTLRDAGHEALTVPTASEGPKV